MAKRILVVDDEPDMVAIMKLTLETKGFQVITAYDGEEGLQKATHEKPDLIILDILLPKAFGSDIATVLERTEETHAIPILFLTNFPLPYLTGNENARNVMQKDKKGNIYLSKSCSDEDLLGALNYLFNRQAAP